MPIDIHLARGARASTRAGLAAALTGAALSAAALLAGPAGAGATAARAAGTAATPSQILGYYNGLRTANGIPGDLTLDSARSADCALHDHYAALNGNDRPNPHQETPGKPGYTSGGDAAARSSELAGGSTLVSVFAPFHRGQPYWSAPFALAPFHLMGLLNPANTSLWGADSEGQLCIGESGPRPDPATDTLYSFPGPGTSVPWAEPYPDEYPTSPEAVAGIPAGTVTGPALIVYWRGPSDSTSPPLDEIAAAALSGPAGPVAVRTVDAQQSALVPSGAGFIIPTAPLTPGARYTATVTFSNADLASSAGVAPRTWTGSFAFTASGPPSPASLVHITAVKGPHDSVTFVTAADFPASGQAAKLTVTSSNPLLRIAGGTGYLPGVGALSLYPLAAPEPGGWLRLTYSVSSYSVGGVREPAVSVSERIAGPPLRSLLTGLRPHRSYSARALSTSGIRLALHVKRQGTLVQAALQHGETVYALSPRVRAGHSGRVTLVLRIPPGLVGVVLAHRRSASLTLALRLAEPGHHEFEIDRAVTVRG